MKYDIHINHLTAQQIDHPISYYKVHFAEDSHIYINIVLHIKG